MLKVFFVIGKNMNEKRSAVVVQRFMKQLRQNRYLCEDTLFNAQNYTKKEILKCIYFNLSYYKTSSIIYIFFPLLLETFNGNHEKASNHILRLFSRFSKKDLVNVIGSIIKEYEKEYDWGYCNDCYGYNNPLTSSRRKMIHPNPPLDSQDQNYYSRHNDYYHDGQYDREFNEINRTYRRNLAQRLDLPEEILENVISYI